MNWLTQLFIRRRRYNELSESIRQHLEEKIADLMADGMTREEAERSARRAFGNARLIEERSREVWQFSLFENLAADLRFAWRQAVKSPRFTIAAIATLAIGIGAQVTIYSVVHAVLIDPFPYRGALRMVHLHLYDKAPIPFDLAMTRPQFLEFQKLPVLDGAIAEDQFGRALTGEELPVQVQTARLSPDGFALLRCTGVAGPGVWARRQRTCGSAELLVLDGALCGTRRHCGENAAIGPRELHHCGCAAAALHVDGEPGVYTARILSRSPPYCERLRAFEGGGERPDG